MGVAEAGVVGEGGRGRGLVLGKAADGRACRLASLVLVVKASGRVGRAGRVAVLDGPAGRAAVCRAYPVVGPQADRPVAGGLLKAARGDGVKVACPMARPASGAGGAGRDSPAAPSEVVDNAAGDARDNRQPPASSSAVDPVPRPPHRPYKPTLKPAARLASAICSLNGTKPFTCKPRKANRHNVALRNGGVFATSHTPTRTLNPAFDAVVEAGYGPPRPKAGEGVAVRAVGAEAAADAVLAKKACPRLGRPRRAGEVGDRQTLPVIETRSGHVVGRSPDVGALPVRVMAKPKPICGRPVAARPRPLLGRLDVASRRDPRRALVVPGTDPRVIAAVDAGLAVGRGQAGDTGPVGEGVVDASAEVNIAVVGVEVGVAGREARLRPFFGVEASADVEAKEGDNLV